MSDFPVLKLPRRRGRSSSRQTAALQPSLQSLELHAVAASAEAESEGLPVAASFGHADARVHGDKTIAAVNELEELSQRYEKLNERLRAAELRSRLLFERNPLPMMVYESGTLQIVSANRALVACYGYSPSELLSMAITDLLPPQEVDSMLALLAVNPGGVSGRSGGFASYPWRHRYKDGTTIDVEVMTANITVDDIDCRIALCENVTERSRASVELAAARHAAVEASNAKTAFLTNMSHELRTPMNGVIAMNELLLDTELTKEQRSYAEQVARSSDEMLALTNDMLDISKIESGTIELYNADFALRETIEQAGAVAALAASAKGITLDLTIDQRVPGTVTGDRWRFRQVLLNLIMNAVKFTATGGVTVRVSTTTSSAARERWTAIRCEVADTGIGINPGTLEKMFEPFTQGDASTTRRFGGTGVGLAIAKELIDLMDGAIGGDSQLGRGSTFWFELDLRLPRLAQQLDEARSKFRGPAGGRQPKAGARMARDLGAKSVQPVVPHSPDGSSPRNGHVGV